MAIYEQGDLRSTAGQHLRAGVAASREQDRGEQGWIVKAKSRLVARGFKQRERVNFGETFSPTVSSSCVRLLSAIACELDLDLCHSGVDQAFVQSHLDEDVFLRLFVERSR